MAEVELPNPEELEERRDKSFSRRVALVTAVYAVVLAVASLGGNNAMKEMLLAQQEASNQWSYYQAKVIREHLNRGNKLVLETQLAEPSALKGAEREKTEALARRFADEEKRMNADKKEIEVVAKKHEATRDLNQSKDRTSTTPRCCSRSPSSWRRSRSSRRRVRSSSRRWRSR